MRMARDAHCRSTKLEIWRRIESLLYPSLHMFSTTELLVLYYALNCRSPKVCSITIREQILSLVMEDFKRLSLPELLLFMMCQASYHKLSLFQQTLTEVKARSKEILAAAKENGPEILVNFFYAYTVSKIPGYLRKNTRGIEQDIAKEASEVLDLFLEEIVAQFSKLSEAAMYRLAYALENSQIENVNEIYKRIENRLMREMDTYDPILRVEFIRVMSRISGRNNGASRAFWERISKMVIEKGVEITPHHAVTIFQALSGASASSKETNSVLIPLCKKYLEKYPPTYTMLKNIMQGVMFSNIQEEDFLVKIFKVFSQMGYYAPAKFYATWGQFRLHIEALFPDWTFTFYDNRCYHAKSDYVPFRGQSEVADKALAEIYSLLTSTDQIDMKVSYDWKSLYLVDIAMYPHLVGVVVDYEGTQPGEPECPRLVLKRRLLKEHGWDLFNLNYLDFTKDPKAVVNKMAEELRNVVKAYPETQKGYEGARFKRRYHEEGSCREDQQKAELSCS